MRPIVRVAGILLMLMCLATPSAITDVASAQGIEEVFFDDYSKDCDASSSVNYEWFFYNNNNSDFLLVVETTELSGTGWESDLNQHVFVVPSRGSVFVNLTVSANSDVTSKSVNQTIFFVFTKLDNPNWDVMKVGYANTTFIPSWGVIAPGKNRLLGRFDNPLPAPLDNNYVTFCVNVGIWAVLALAFMYVIDPIVRMFTKKTKTNLDDRILKILHKPVFVLVIVYGLVSSFQILPLSEGEVAAIFEVYGVALIAIVTFIAYRLFKEVITFIGKRYAARTKSEIDNILVPVFENIGAIVILIFGGIGIVEYLGYDITFLLAGVGVAGLVIAFAAQDFLSNFFTYMSLLIDRPFVEGEYVQLETGETCKVEKIGMRSCRLLDVFSNNYIILPNNKLVNGKVVNLDEPDGRGVGEITLSVPLTSNPQTVEKMLLETANKHSDVLKDKGLEPSVRLSGFSESGYDFKLFFGVANFMQKWRVAHELRKEIVNRFEKEGIEIAVPQRTVVVRDQSKRGSSQ